jgi:hypothetical protein
LSFSVLFPVTLGGVWNVHVVPLRLSPSSPELPPLVNVPTAMQKPPDVHETAEKLDDVPGLSGAVPCSCQSA